MAADGDLKEHALNSSHDFYDLLGVPSTANDSEIRRAYRKTALKYHPDKVGASDTAALEKFHLLQIAYDVLLESDVRQLYDNARRAREEKKEREQAYEGRRRQMKEDLERRENAGVAGLKRKREEASEEEAFQRELKRLAADGARRRREREEQLRKEAQEEFERENTELNGVMSNPDRASTPVKERNTGSEEVDRTISLRYPADTTGSSSKQLGREELISRFKRFGKVEDAILRNKKLKVDGEKHRREYTTAIIVFESIVGAHAAVTDVLTLAAGPQGNDWKVFENVTWAGGKEPDCIPKTARNATPKTDGKESNDVSTGRAPSTPILDKFKNADAGGGLRKVPSFGSFKGTPKSAVQTPGTTPGGVGSPSVEELTMIRLKNAERRRLAEKLRKEEAEAEAAEAAGEAPA
jgi:DnaJ family protein C protein 17